MIATGAKAHAFAKSPPANIWAILAFSDDEGVAADLGRTVLAKWSETGPTERIVLTEDEIGREPARFFDTLEARSLLGDARIIWLQLTNERQAKYIVEAVDLAERDPGRFDTRLIVTCGALKKTSKLRKAFDNAKSAASLQVFADTQDDLESMVRDTLASATIEIAPDALTSFVAGLPGHRRLAQTELEKLTLYGADLGRAITISDVTALVATEADAALVTLVDATLTGQTGIALTALERLESSGTSGITLLRALQREATRLLDAHSRRVNSAQAARQLRPPVWPDQWPIFSRKLSIWNSARLVRMITRIRSCEADTKRAGPIGNAATRVLISDMLRVAAN